MPNNIRMPYNSGPNICHNNKKSHECNKIAELTKTVMPPCVGKCLRLTFSQTWKKPCLNLAKACLQSQNFILFLRIINQSTFKQTE